MRLARVAVLLSLSCWCAAQTNPAAAFDPLKFFIGQWRGTVTGEPGKGTVERTYDFVLDGKFLRGVNTSVYPPQDKNPKGERHQNWDLFSYDRARKKFVLRQFHVEGFVNEYLQDEAPGPRHLRFTTERIENIPPGWRARETYTIVSENEFLEKFELAEPGKDFVPYSESQLKRVK